MLPKLTDPQVNLLLRPDLRMDGSIMVLKDVCLLNALSSGTGQGWRAVNGVGWDISLGVELLFLHFSTLSRLTWGFVSLAHAVSKLIFSSDLTLELEE